MAPLPKNDQLIENQAASALKPQTHDLSKKSKTQSVLGNTTNNATKQFLFVPACPCFAQLFHGYSFNGRLPSSDHLYKGATGGWKHQRIWYMVLVQ